MIYGVGDTHTPANIHKLNTKNFPQQRNMTKDDYIIVMGDFGLIWDHVMTKADRYWMEWLNNKNFTTLFLDGNHENHYKLLSGITAPDVVNSNGDYIDENGYIIEKKFGGYVGKISDSIYHLRRGEIYIIEGKKFFVMGGAASIDKLNRIEGISWWKEEEPSNKEFYYGLDNLDKHHKTVDYILGHTAPESIIKKYILHNKDLSGKPDSNTKFFDRVIEITQFKKFYCGHWHKDLVFDKYHFLYENIVLIN